MTDAITLLTASMRADAEQLRLTSQNVANLQTLGYRREISVQQSTFDVLSAAHGADEFAPLAPSLQAAIDARSGPLQLSTNPWSVAIEGEGYFVVSTPSGEQMTRRGDFSLDASGRLTSHDGFAVLGEAGEITPPAGAPTIDADGTIHVNGQVIDRLRRVTADSKALVPAGDTRFAAATDTALTESSSNAIRQGFVEGSNVTPVEELMRLMETMRHFEMTQHYVRGTNDLLSDAINTLGKN